MKNYANQLYCVNFLHLKERRVLGTTTIQKKSSTFVSRTRKLLKTRHVDPATKQQQHLTTIGCIIRTYMAPIALLFSDIFKSTNSGRLESLITFANTKNGPAGRFSFTTFELLKLLLELLSFFFFCFFFRPPLAAFLFALVVLFLVGLNTLRKD